MKVSELTYSQHQFLLRVFHERVRTSLPEAAEIVAVQDWLMQSLLDAFLDRSKFNHQLGPDTCLVSFTKRDLSTNQYKILRNQFYSLAEEVKPEVKKEETAKQQVASPKPKAKPKKQKQMLSFQVDKDFAQALEEAAERDHLTLSSFIRYHLGKIINERKNE